MKIKGKNVVIYALKVYKNVTFVVAYNTEKERYAHFEISGQYNEVDKIIKLFRNPTYFFIGYGSKHYDNIFLNYIIKKRDHIEKLGSNYITKTFYEKILDSLKRRDWDDEMIELKYAQNFDYIDLDMMLSTKFSHHTIYEQSFREGMPHSVEIDDDDYVAFDAFDAEIDKIERRLKIIDEILSKNKDKVELRVEMFGKYNSDVLDNNDTSALNTILLDRYQEQNHIKYEDLIPKSDYLYSTPVINLISNDIKFDTEEFNEFLEQLKPMTYTSQNPVLRRFVSYDTTNVLFSTSGVECEHNSNIFKSDRSQKIYMLHIDSLDASVCLRYGIYPERLTNSHDNTMLFRKMFDEFLACALKSPVGSNRKKLFTSGLDDIVSKYNVKKTWLYDPSRFARMKVNSNLILMMLIEQLLIYGATLILIEDNTVVFSSFIDMGDIIDKWGKKFGFSYSCIECKKFFKYSVYDYFALDHNNRVITNGMFDGNDINTFSPAIVMKAVRNNLLYNTDIENTVKNAGRISDFLMFHKLSGNNKRFMYRGLPLGQEVTFYVTTQPLPTLYIEEKLTSSGQYARFEPIIKNVHISVFEKYMAEPNSNVRFNIDYDYYVNKAKAIIDEIKTVQTIIEMPKEEKDEKTGNNQENNED